MRATEPFVTGTGWEGAMNGSSPFPQQSTQGFNPLPLHNGSEERKNAPTREKNLTNGSAVVYFLVVIAANSNNPTETPLSATSTFRWPPMFPRFHLIKLRESGQPRGS